MAPGPHEPDRRRGPHERDLDLSPREIGHGEQNGIAHNRSEWLVLLHARRYERRDGRNAGASGLPVLRRSAARRERIATGSTSRRTSSTSEPFGGSRSMGRRSTRSTRPASRRGRRTCQRIEGDAARRPRTPLPPTPRIAAAGELAERRRLAGGSNGTEYLLGALEFSKGNITLDDRIAVWALTNTQSLTTTTPNVQVDDVVVTTQVYGAPPDAIQKTGPTPSRGRRFRPTSSGRTETARRSTRTCSMASTTGCRTPSRLSGKLWGALRHRRENAERAGDESGRRTLRSRLPSRGRRCPPPSRGRAMSP